MNYQQTIDYLYALAPLFQNIGQGAYKEGLANTRALDAHFGHPHRHYRTIHVAGTNGKGSCSHTLASVLQEAGLRVGLYTSPHLLDFRERIRVNGTMISEQRVIDFVEQERAFFEPLHPSFFELTTALAFTHFAEQQVDVAVIEVGLGGRLDCTNIITPDLSVITNISLDHTALLGDTLPLIAAEKAGIIKPHIPVIIGETQAETRPVFLARAAQEQAPIHFAEGEGTQRPTRPAEVQSHTFRPDGGIDYDTTHFGHIHGELDGLCQPRNTNTVLCALRHLPQDFYHVTPEAVRRGFERVSANTHLMGRWQQVADHPRTVCDTGHNPGGFDYIARQLRTLRCRTLRVVLGMVNDKDVESVMALLPPTAVYYFCQPSVRRALPVADITAIARRHHLQGRPYGSVAAASEAARAEAAPDDFLYVGGSTYVVSDFLRTAQAR